MASLQSRLRPLIVRSYGLYFNLLAVVRPRVAGKKALATFRKVRKGRVKPEQASYLEAARSEIEQLEEHRIQTYRWRGEGMKVMLVHGWESNTYRWRNLIAYLREHGYDTLAFDAPGHGYSSGDYLHAPLYARCLDFMIRKHRPVAVIGHSMGGLSTLYQQYKYGNQGVEKIVTIGSPSDFREIVDDYQRLLGFNNRVRRALGEVIQKDFGFPIEEFSTAAFAGSLKARGLLFHDRLDRIAPFHASEQVHRAWAGSELVATEGLGHSMHQERVNRRILEFLQKAV